jgi:hypothetical protein
VHTKSLLGCLWGRLHSEVLSIAGGDNIKMDLKEIVWVCRNWIHLGQGKDGCEFLWTRQQTVWFLSGGESCDWVSEC